MKSFKFILPALFLISCAPQVAQVDLEAEKAAVVKAAEAYHQAGEATDTDAIAALYSSNARVYPPGGAVVSGTENVRQFVADFSSLKNLQIHFGAPEVHVGSGGDMAYSIADVSMSFEDADGHRISEEIRDFHLWEKENDEWKLAVDIWNSPAPPTGASGEASQE